MINPTQSSNKSHSGPASIALILAASLAALTALLWGCGHAPTELPPPTAMCDYEPTDAGGAYGPGCCAIDHDAGFSGVPCFATTCCTELTACQASAACIAYVQCYTSDMCEVDPAPCCFSEQPTGAALGSAFLDCLGPTCVE